LARWTALDPSGIKDGPNRYAYVKNQPIHLLDPTGNEGTWFERGIAAAREKAQQIAKAPDPLLEVAKTAVSVQEHVREVAKPIVKDVVSTASAYRQEVYATATKAVVGIVEPGAEVYIHALRGEGAEAAKSLLKAEVEYHPLVQVAKAVTGVLGAAVSIPSNVSGVIEAKTPEERGAALARTVVSTGVVVLAATGTAAAARSAAAAAAEAGIGGGIFRVLGRALGSEEIAEAAARGFQEGAAEAVQEISTGVAVERPVVGAGTATGRFGTLAEILANPSVLKGLTPAEVTLRLAGEIPPGWKVETLGKGAHAGEGWVLREYTAKGDPTGRQLRWHPGGGQHGPDPYWRVIDAETKSGIIR
jgi:hypothetical protein